MKPIGTQDGDAFLAQEFAKWTVGIVSLSGAMALFFFSMHYQLPEERVWRALLRASVLLLFCEALGHLVGRYLRRRGRSRMGAPTDPDTLS